MFGGWSADFPQDTLLEYGELLERVAGNRVHKNDGVTEVFLPLPPVLDERTSQSVKRMVELFYHQAVNPGLKHSQQCTVLLCKEEMMKDHFHGLRQYL